MTNQPDQYGMQYKEITLPSGKKQQKLYWHHPGSVVLLPLMDDQVMMLKQFRFTLDQVILEVPAGTRDPGEDVEVCAHRELREETGHQAKKLTFLGDYWPAPGMTDEQFALYLAEDMSPAPLPQDEDEQIETVLMSFDDLIAMAIEGEINDAKSVVALIRAARYLGKI